MTWKEVMREIYHRPNGVRRRGWCEGMRMRAARLSPRYTTKGNYWYGRYTGDSIDFLAPLEVWEQCDAMGYGNSQIQALYCDKTADDWEWVD